MQIRLLEAAFVTELVRFVTTCRSPSWNYLSVPRKIVIVDILCVIQWKSDQIFFSVLYIKTAS